MATKTETAFSSISDLKLWFRNQEGIDLKMSDIPEVIPLRWSFFKDRWEFIRNDVLAKADTYEFPDLLIDQITKLTNFIDRQKNSQNTAINPFSNSVVFSNYYAVWDNIFLSSLPLTRQEENLIKDKMIKVTRFVKTDFENMRVDFVAARDELADVTGLSDIDYNTTFDMASVRSLRDIKISDITLMQTYMSAIRNVDFILANSTSLETNTVDPFALARANADNPDIEIQDGKSGQLVKMNFGDSLQILAQRYLNNPDRWIEIAIANGLKPPYVDEIGEKLLLIANGDINQINIAATNTNGEANINKLYINQAIFLQSDTIKFPEQRSITNIKEVPISGEIVLELSGDVDLDKYKIDENAHIRVFKPNTINSNFLVMIPSDQPLSTEQVGETPFFLLSKSEDEKRAGVDLAINDDADIVFTSNSDLQLSFGVANALQAVKLKMVSERGQLPRHPNYGLPVVVGQKANDPSELQGALVAGVTDMISADPRFDRIEQLDVRHAAGNTFTIGMVVRMAGTGTLVPLSFTINTG